MTFARLPLTIIRSMIDSLYRAFISIFLILVLSLSVQASTLLQKNCEKHPHDIHQQVEAVEQHDEHHRSSGVAHAHPQPDQQHAQTKRHEHKHRHGPGEPEHSHEHDHSTATLCPGLDQVTPGTASVSIPPLVDQKSFTPTLRNLHADPALSFIFRPPIA